MGAPVAGSSGAPLTSLSVRVPSEEILRTEKSGKVTITVMADPL